MPSKYTKDEIDRANNLSILAYCDQSTVLSYKRVGQDQYEVTDARDGMKYQVNTSKNIYYNFYNGRGSNQKGSGGTIDFVREVNDMDFLAAMEELVGPSRSVSNTKSYTPKKKVPPQNYKAKNTKPEFRAPKRAENNKAAFAYLVKTRKINPSIVSFFMNRGEIYQSDVTKANRTFRNVVFVGKDNTGKVVLAQSRGANSFAKESFRRNASGSDLKYPFRYKGKNDALIVCEAPIDVLSHMSMNLDQWQESSYIALCGVAEVGLMAFIKDHQPKEIILALDNDLEGQKATKRIMEHLQKDFPNIKVSTAVPHTKDWNEDLVQGRSLPEKTSCDFVIKEGIITKFLGSQPDVVIPNNIQGESVCAIGINAFYNSPIRSIVLPEGLKEIYDFGFQGCENLNRITLPTSLEVIGVGAFSGCSALKQVDLPDGLKKLETHAFEKTGLETIKLPASIEKMEDHVFSNCKNLTFAEIPQNLPGLDETTFAGDTSLTTLQITDGYSYDVSGSFEEVREDDADINDDLDIDFDDLDIDFDDLER